MLALQPSHCLVLQAGTTAKPHNRQPEGADPPRAATPPASTWIGQRRNLDANMVAAINNFDKEEAESSSRRSAAHQVILPLCTIRGAVPSVSAIQMFLRLRHSAILAI